MTITIYKTSDSSVLTAIQNLFFNNGSSVHHQNDESFEFYFDATAPGTFTVNPPSDFEIHDGTNWQSSPFTASPLTNMKARLSSGLSAGVKGPVNLTVTSGSDSCDLALTGEAIDVSSNWTTWHNSLTGDKPSGGLAKALNDLIDGNVTDGNDTHLDYWLQCGGMETDEQRLRPLIDLSAVGDATPVNSPTLDQSGMRTGIAPNKYIQLNWIPTAHAVKYAQNDSTYGCYVVSGIPASAPPTPSLMGVNVGGNGHRASLYISGRTFVGCRHNCNYTVAQSFNYTATGDGGYYSSKRTGSTSGVLRKDLATGNFSPAVYMASTGISNQEFFGGSANSGGAPSIPVNGGVYSMFIMGDSSIDDAAFRARQRTFLTARGITLPN